MDRFDAIQVKTRDADVKVARQVRLKQRSATAATIVSTTRGQSRLEPNMYLVQRQPLPANGNSELILNIPFGILLTKVCS